MDFYMPSSPEVYDRAKDVRDSAEEAWNAYLKALREGDWGAGMI